MERCKVSSGVKHQSLVSLLKELASVSQLYVHSCTVFEGGNSTYIHNVYYIEPELHYLSCHLQAEVMGGEKDRAVHTLEEALEIAEARLARELICIKFCLTLHLALYIPPCPAVEGVGQK